MKALVTGGSGFIGSTLIESLTRRGISVDVLMRKTSSDRHLQGLDYRRREGDITDFESLKRAVADVDVIFHLAGVIAAKDRTEYFRFNAEGTANLARAAEEVNQSGGGRVKRFVYVSSMAAGGPAPTSTPRTENDVDAPVSAYGESKRAGEAELLRHRDAFLPLILRPPLVYGPKDQATLLLVKTVAKRIIPKFAASTADGEKYYSVIHSSDLVEAIATLGTVAAERVSNGDVFYISSGEEVSASRLMGAMASALGVKTFTLPLPAPVLRFAAVAATIVGRVLGKSFVLNRDKLHEILPDYWTCSNLKLMTKTSWRPQIHLESGMKDAVDWYRTNGWI
ncbi:MAG: NAD-dependent epimerase/dehydratase family protein [Cryobacterium sp.]|nr:NAD-dependent epimerase/dehydratase family protein [Oligoflexia bacterium]